MNQFKKIADSGDEDLIYETIELLKRFERNDLLTPEGKEGLNLLYNSLLKLNPTEDSFGMMSIKPNN